MGSGCTRLLPHGAGQGAWLEIMPDVAQLRGRRAGCLPTWPTRALCALRSTCSRERERRRPLWPVVPRKKRPGPAAPCCKRAGPVYTIARSPARARAPTRARREEAKCCARAGGGCIRDGCERAGVRWKCGAGPVRSRPALRGSNHRCLLSVPKPGSSSTQLGVQHLLRRVQARERPPAARSSQRSSRVQARRPAGTACVQQLQLGPLGIHHGTDCAPPQHPTAARLDQQHSQLVPS